MRLTRLQLDVLFVVAENGPVTAHDVAYHLPIGRDSARGVLARLEEKLLIDATYTGHPYQGRQRAFVARQLGRIELDRDRDPVTEGETK